jgi:hypothetical protein
MEDRIAELRVARRLHADERLQKLGAIPANHVLQDFLFKLPGNYRIPDEVPAIEKRRVRLHVRLIESLEVIGVANLMTDFELQSPERVQHTLYRLFVDFVFKEEKEVDVGFRMESSPPIAANG